MIASREREPDPSGAATPERRVLVIDDDEIMRLSVEEILRRTGYHVEVFGSGRDGLARLPQFRPQLLVVDLKMPEMDGFQVMELARSADPELVIVVITGYATIGTAVEAMKAGAYDFLPKPFTPDELRLIISRGHERWSLARKAARLQREKQDLERRFVTFVAHQLKSPLVAVKQYLDVLLFTLRQDLPEKAVLWVGRCQVRVADMLTLIQDWLALAKLESGALSQREARTDLAAVVVQSTHDHEHQAEAAGVTLQAQGAEAPTLVQGDQLALTMLVGNLLGNAIKYNRAGGRVSVRLRRGARHAELEVEDTGIGIPAADLPRLFTEFFRARTGQEIPGTGLGLAICKRIVDDLGGTMSVRSLEGTGTTFVVRLLLDAA